MLHPCASETGVQQAPCKRGISCQERCLIGASVCVSERQRDTEIARLGFRKRRQLSGCWVRSWVPVIGLGPWPRSEMWDALCGAERDPGLGRA